MAFEGEGHTRLLENGGLAPVRALLDAVEEGRAEALLGGDASWRLLSAPPARTPATLASG